jgi:hypothetical protein
MFAAKSCCTGNCWHDKIKPRLFVMRPVKKRGVLLMNPGKRRQGELRSRKRESPGGAMMDGLIQGATAI